MAQDVSGFGSVVTLQCIPTFPILTITQFADDADPLDFAAIDIADKAMGVNGDLITWAKANPITLVLNVIPGSPDDTNLQLLADANRPAQGKLVAADLINATVVYPDFSSVTLITGRLMNAMFGKSIASAGRLKTRPYVFAFQDKVGA